MTDIERVLNILDLRNIQMSNIHFKVLSKRISKAYLTTKENVKVTFNAVNMQSSIGGWEITVYGLPITDSYIRDPDDKIHKALKLIHEEAVKLGRQLFEEMSDPPADGKYGRPNEEGE